MEEGSEQGFETISVYTRAEAIADGSLVEVPASVAKEAGFKIPLAVTAGVWAQCVALTPAAERAGNDESGRLWDVVWLASVSARRYPDLDRVEFTVRVVRERVRPTPTLLVLRVGPGDDAQPVATVMFPGED